MTLDLQICSDIHLEYYSQSRNTEPINFGNIVFPNSPNSILILAGDIGHVNNATWQAFMKYVGTNWQHVIYVLGNHEYYSNSKDMSKLLTAYKDHLAQYPNIHLLNRDKLKIEDYDILGLTMWTQNEYSTVMQINDFKQIKMHNDIGHLKPITLTQYNALHDQDKAWLFANIDPTRKTIIVTHFPLTRDGVNHPKYAEQKSALCNYYANEFHHGLVSAYGPCEDNQLIIISGHTHFNYDFVKDNIRYISNCYSD
jgi:predicted MPP superfamily phosphohydrolase